MDLKRYYDTINLDEIQRFIDEKQEENLSLEFKTVNHPEYNQKNREYDKKNISKVISGFANSNGGIVIWGIKAQQDSSGQDVAKTKKPISKLLEFINFLNRLEGQATTPIVLGIEHQKIEISNDHGYVKTFIPASGNAPHMANFADKHYYKRSGDSFYLCEHYDILDMVNRKRSPNLEVEAKVTGKKLIRNQRVCRWEVLISVINSSPNIAKYPYLALNLSKEFRVAEYGLDGNYKTGLTKVRDNMSYRYNYSGGINQVIYPQAILDVDSFFTELPKGTPPPNLEINYIVSAEHCEIKTGNILVSPDMFLKNAKEI